MEYTFSGDELTPADEEVQIIAMDSVPMVGGKLVGVGAAWYKVDANTGKVTIGYPALGLKNAEVTEIIREFDINDVSISSYLVGT